MHKVEKRKWYKNYKIWIGVVVVLLIIIGLSPNPSEKPTETREIESALSQPKESTKTWDMNNAYEKIQNGMTKEQVEEVTARTSENCTESQNEYTGKSEICFYGSAFIDKGSISVTYTNDEVTSKTKSSY